MARRSDPQLQFDALSLEGALFPPEWLAKVAALEAPAQSPADYGIPKGLQLRDDIGRFWRIAEALWVDFMAARGGADSAGSARRFAHDLLSQVFGFADLNVAGERGAGGRVFPLAFETSGGRVPVVVGPPIEDLDQSVPRHGDSSPRQGQLQPRRRSAWGALQEYLNAAAGALWGIATNGLILRLGRDNASLTRPAWLEADLERIFTEQRFADFSVLWLLLHASRFGRADQPVQEAPLERWRDEALKAGSTARARMSANVEQALRELGQGFVSHPTNTELRAALASGALTPADYFSELLRLVYRMIFLLTVEERGVLHPLQAAPDAVAIYTDGYGMRRLRERALRHAAHDRHEDLWASLRPVFAGLGRADGEPALGLPGLGGLFAADQCPHLNDAALENRSLLAAVFRLAWLREGDALARVNWRDMGVEEFGSVYESLLELVPVVGDGGRRFGFAWEGESAGNARKLTGSYYTPDALVQQLLDAALEPAVAQRLAEYPAPADAERALLSLAVVDPACGSGHFLLATARRLAGHLARLRAGGTPGTTEYRHALRDVVTHCIYGVDRNPMALELARIALWLEAYTPDRALGFLDHHLVCGDALLGLLDLGVLKAGIPDEAFKTLTGDDKDVTRLLAKLNRTGRKALDTREKQGQRSLELGTRSLAEAFSQLDAVADDELSDVEAKRAQYAVLRAQAAASPLALAADVFVGAFLMPKRLKPSERAITEQQAAGRFPTSATLGMALEGTLTPSHTVALAARAVCAEKGVLHWPLTFPQVFARGGFDVVLGNPPWETMSPDRREFYSLYAPNIATLSPDEQDANVAELLRDPTIAAAWDKYSRDLYVDVSFMKSSGRYTRFAQGNLGKGDFNVYRQFVELALDSARQGGFAAQLVPENFYNGANAAGLRESIFADTTLSVLLGFENQRGHWFPSIDSRMKLALYATKCSGSTTSFRAAFLLRTHAELLHARAEPLLLDVALIREFSPDSLAVMEFSNQYEIAISRKMYARFPRLGDEVPGLSERSLVAELHMGNDRGIFVDDPEGLPVFEGSMVSHFDYRAKAYVEGRGRSTTWEPVSFASEKKRVAPQWFVRCEDVPDKRRERLRVYRIGFCNVARASDRRTLMSALIPPMTLCGDTVPTLHLSSGTAADVLLCLAVANSLVMDFLVRMKVSAHVTMSLMDSLPLPRSLRSCPQARPVAALAARLTLAGPEMEDFRAQVLFEGELADVDTEPCYDVELRSCLEAELNARVARDVFALSREELAYVLDPADVLGTATSAETFRSLRDQELRALGEYRTRRLVLEAWDRLFVE